MSNQDLVVGEVVALSRFHTWAVGTNNPLTKYGIVTSVRGSIHVLWLNGVANTYSRTAVDLIPVVHATRQSARLSAASNPNLQVVNVEGLWHLKFRPQMVLNDMREDI